MLYLFKTEEETHIEIDNNILSFILNPPDLSEWQVNELDGRHYEVFGYLLVWMLMLDHFNDIVSLFYLFFFGKNNNKTLHL